MAAGLRQREVGQHLGISQESISRFEREDVVPNEAERQALVGLLGGDPGDWAAAAGLAEARPPGIAEPLGSYAPRPSDAQLPVAGTLRAGVMHEAGEETGEWFPCLQEHAAAADFVVRIEGDSLYPLILPGDFVAFRRASSASPGDIVVVRTGDETLVKRYAGRRSGRVILESVNPLYPPLQAERAEIVGVFAWQHRPKEALRGFGR